MSDDDPVCANCGHPYRDHIVLPGFCRTGMEDWPSSGYGTAVVGVICPTALWKRSDGFTPAPTPVRRPRAYYPDED